MRNGILKAWIPLLAAGLITLMAVAASAREPVTVKLWNYSIHDKKYQQKMYRLFNERHPEIKIEYTSISNTMYDQTLEAAFIAREPPDIFIPYGKLTFEYLRSKGFIIPLNECAPSQSDLKEWMAKFPASLHKFGEGVNLFDGKVYNVDLGGDSYNEYALFGNMTVLKKAGIEKLPSTYDDMLQSAAKVTSVGQGKYFGIVHGMKLWASWLMDAFSLARSAGGRGVGGPWAGPDLKDGKFHANSPSLTNALKVWMEIRGDGSVFPGETQMEDEQAKMAFATNKAALQFGGYWNIGNYVAYNSEADFDLVLPPLPDRNSRRAPSYTSSVGSTLGYLVSSLTKDPRAVWEVIKFISSVEYQEGYVQGGFGVSYLPEANRRENFIQQPQLYKYVQWAMDPNLIRVGPGWSADARKAFDLMAGIYPTYGDVLDNVYQGKIGFEALEDLDRRSDSALDEGIKKAQEAGIKVTRADFVFADWDPEKDYQSKKK